MAVFQCGNRKSTIAPKRRSSGGSNMQASERAEVNDGADIFLKLEGEIRELVRGDAIAPALQQGNDNELAAGNRWLTAAGCVGDLGTSAPAANELAVGNVGSLLQNASRTSVQEIEKLIAELQTLRGKLQNEAARVEHEIVGYALRIQNAKKSISAISESLSFCRKDHDTAKVSG
jgi:hypothetical protein